MDDLLLSPVVTTQHIAKDFTEGDQTLRVLHDINLTIWPNELVIIVGPSGSGKTTLLSIIGGILAPTVGNILINNIELTSLEDQAKTLLRRSQMGFIFQQSHLFPALTAVENVMMPLIIANMSYQQAFKKSVEILHRLEMSDAIEKLPSHLSGGQLQRVAIGRSIVHNPSLVICDEPTASLDSNTGERVMNILKEISLEPSRGVLVVTHDTRTFKFANRILQLSDGYLSQ